MRPRLIGLVGLLVLFLVTTVAVAQDLNLGNVYFPRSFVHGDKTYASGVYRVILTEKEGVPWFMVHDGKGTLVLEEMGVVTPRKSRLGKRGFRLRREMLRGYEFFRVRVVKPDRWVMAYFMVKK